MRHTVPIISVSLNDDILGDIEEVGRIEGFGGRSATIRECIQSFVLEKKQQQKLDGRVNAVLLVVHGDRYDKLVSGLKHRFEDLIKTHLHSKMDNDKCMDLFVIKGRGKTVGEMVQDFQTNKNMDVVKLIRI